MKIVFVTLFSGMLGCTLVQTVSAEGTAKYNEKVLYSFCSQQNCADGKYPYAGLIDVKGTLYGTTFGGGRQCSTDIGCGTVFSLDSDTGTETVLYAFCGQQNCVDGANPAVSLIDAGDKLYGTTAYGGETGCGDTGCGTVFAINRKTDKEKVLYAFCQQQNCDDGEEPSGLIDKNGILYGTTDAGGGAGWGTIFSLDPVTDAKTVLYSFNGYPSDGAGPTSLIDVKGTLYGVTADGGATGVGTVFSFDPKTGAEKVVYSFCSQENCSDGSYPNPGLLAMNDKLYGTAYLGGNNDTNCNYGCGTVFSVDPGTGTETVLHSFQGGTDGAAPFGSLIEIKGALFGTTSIGGGNGCRGGCGTIFSVTPKSGMEKVLYSFQGGTDGAYPSATLLYVNDTLYGTTEEGGASGGGTVFALTKQR